MTASSNDYNTAVSDSYGSPITDTYLPPDRHNDHYDHSSGEHDATWNESYVLDFDSSVAFDKDGGAVAGGGTGHGSSSGSVSPALPSFACCSTVKVTMEAECYSQQAAKSGRYTECGSWNDLPVFKQLTGGNFIFWHGHDNWHGWIIGRVFNPREPIE